MGQIRRFNHLFLLLIFFRGFSRGSGEDFLEDFFAFVRDILTFWLVDSDFYEKSSSNGYFALLEA